MRYWIFLIVPLLVTLMSPAQARAPISKREQNAAAAFVVQSQEFEAALNRQLDERLATLKGERDRAIARADDARKKLANAKSDNKALGERAEFAEGEVRRINLEMTARVAEKDAQFARELPRYLDLGNLFIETPEGLDVLEKYNAGGRTSYPVARQLLDEAMASRSKARELRAAHDHDLEISDRQFSATFDYDAMSKGMQTNAVVIQRYEAVVEAAPNSASDWLRLAELYRNANALDKAITSASKAYDNETTDYGRTRALLELGDTQLLRVNNQAGVASAEDGMNMFVNALAQFPEMSQGMAGLDAIEKKHGPEMAMRAFKEFGEAFSRVAALLDSTPEYLEAHGSFLKAQSQIASMPATKENQIVLADILSRLSTISKGLQNAEEVAFFKTTIAGFFKFLDDGMALFSRQSEMPVEEFAAAETALNERGQQFDNIFKQQPPTSQYAEKADSYSREAQSILWALWKTDREDIATTRALVRSFDASAHNRPGNADIYAADALSMMQQLAAREPDINIIQYELAGAYLLSAYGAVNRSPRPDDYQRVAHQHHEDALKIYKDLVKDDPKSALFQRGLAAALTAIADFSANPADRAALVRQYETMQQLGLLAPLDEQMLAMARLAAKMGAMGPNALPFKSDTVQ